jgi:hypothetical protein
MNLQEIIEPIGVFLESTFESVLVPISNMFNWVVIFGGFIGLFVWLKMQSSFNKQAEKEGTIA